MIKITVLFFAIFMLLLTQSCKKEAVKDSPTPVTQQAAVDFSAVNVDNNVLAFESISSYTAIVDHEDLSTTDAFIEHAQKLPFDSYAKQEKKAMDFESMFIETILNKNRIVKIGKWFIKINIEAERVYALSDEFQEDYKTFLTDQPSGSNIYQFSTDEDVLDLLADEDLLNSRGLFCGESGAGSSPFDQTRYFAFVPANSYPASRYEFDCKIKYLRVGIYYSLKASMEVEKETRTRISPIATVSSYQYPDIPVRIFSYRKYKIRCGTEHGWHPVVTAKTDNKISYKSYQGSKRLSKYWMKIGFEAAYPGSGGYVNVWSQALGAPYQLQIKSGY